MQTLRSLQKSPGFALVAILTVALGIASVSAVYSVARAVLFRPLPFQDESTLVWIWSTRPDRDRAFFSIANFLDLKQANTSMEGLAAVTPLGASISGLAEPERVSGWRVTADLFPVLGVTPHLGQVPATGEAAVPSAMLGHAYWQRRFGGDPAVVGRSLVLNGTPHTVTGVLPRDFIIPGWDHDVVLAQPLETDARRANRGTAFLRGIARLKPGVTLAQARAEFTELNARLVRDYPDDNALLTPPRLLPLREEVTGNYRHSLLLLLGAAGALLLIMCANLAVLLAARAITRQRDAALCSALGASPGRLLRLYLAEGLVIAGIGGVLGALACWWSMEALLSLAPADLPRAALVQVDAHVIGLALLCTVVTGLGVGLAPALRLARTAPMDVLKSHAATSTPRSLARSILVATQMALCTVLPIGTGLLVRSLREVLASHPGFEPTGVLTAQVALTGPPTRTVADFSGFMDEYLRRLRALPGVTSASVTSVLPLTGINTRSEFSRSDKPPADPTDSSSAANRFIGETYFTATGIPLVAGRDFNEHDKAGARGVVIIDEALARRDWPGEDPVGKSIRLKDGPAVREVEIVGIVGNTKNFTLEEKGTPTLYIPARQMPATQLVFLAGRMNYVVKTAGDPAALKESVRRELRAVAPDAAVTMRTLGEATAWARAPRIFNLQLLGFFSACAVLLAGMGLYAVTAQSVAARTREIGIRVALGADARRILREVLGRAGLTAALGVGSGLLLACLLAPLVASMLYGVQARDTATYAAVALLLGALGLLAAWLPAKRATKIDPLIALRAE